MNDFGSAMRADAEYSAVREHRRAERELPTQTVGIVEHDDAVRESLHQMLVLNHIGAASFASPHQFLNEANIDGYSCFLFDFQLPGVNGLELLEILRSRKITAPAIILVGSRNQQILNRAVRAGALAVLEKPAAAQELLGWLNRALARA
jgi:FixJ family two-component response regulator